MMSGNSSSSNYIKIQKNLLGNRKWLVILAFLTFILYNGVFLALALSTYDAKPVMTAKDLLSYIGFDRIITIVGAILLGLESFHWLDSRTKLDFYWSQPVSKRSLFVSTVINSMGIYTASYLLSLLIGFVIAGIGGGMNGSVLLLAFIGFIRNFFLFLSVYFYAVLAVMLTGNIIVAVIADAVLLTFEPLFDWSINHCMGFLKTKAYGSAFTTHGILSPLYTVTDSMSTNGAILRNLFCALLSLVLSYLLYKHRKAEDAGNSVPLPVVRRITKVILIFLCCILSTVFCADSGTITAATGAVIAVMIISAVVVGGIMEAIYNSDVRAAFRGYGYSIAGCAAALILFLGCYYDIAGYNRWVPAAQDVKSAYITPEGVNDSYRSSYLKKYMKLTDIDTLNSLLTIGEQTITRDPYAKGIRLNISYRMKNGHTRTRRVIIPGSAFSSMNSVFKSQSFKEGFFTVYHDSHFTSQKDFEITYYYMDKNAEENRTKTVTGSNIDIYKKIREAYIKDLDSYDIDTAAFETQAGKIEIMTLENGVEKERTFLPVYKSFTNTINALKSEDMYADVTPLSDYCDSDSMPFYLGQRSSFLGHENDK